MKGILSLKQKRRMPVMRMMPMERAGLQRISSKFLEGLFHPSSGVWLCERCWLLFSLVLVLY